MKKKTKEAKMSLQELVKDIGKTFKHSFDGLLIEVKINDVKYAYGNKRYLVTALHQESNAVWIKVPDKIDFTGNGHTENELRARTH